MKKFLLLLALVVAGFTSSAGVFLDIRIYTGFKITSFTFTPQIGKYSLFLNDEKIDDVLKTESLRFTIDSGMIRVHKNGVNLGLYPYLTVSGSGLLNMFNIAPDGKDVKARNYDDNLRLSIVNDQFLLINHVELERYVSGVVESEGGGSVRNDEFYLVQAIACRTYALNNMKKHAKQGFNLCDSVHCQLYQGHCHNSDILSATYRTIGDVIVDKDMKMISAAFHSNSGGQTVNSEDIWKIPTSYLKSVTDTFSLGMPGAVWEKEMGRDEWLNYLKDRFNYPVDQAASRDYALNFRQDSRKVFFADSIPLTSIRNDLQLRSTFFSIILNGNNVLFKGRGYGHGVGLSQQGAIKMARLGYTCVEIIKFYYKDVEIMNYEQLMTK